MTAITPTEGFWQDFTAAPERAAPPYSDRFSVKIAEGCHLSLPLRRLPGTGDRAVASLIANQAALPVVDRLSQAMADLARGLAPDIVVGLPTLGLALAPGVARGLAFRHYVPLGYSRKFWYDEALSVEIASLTSPGAGKRLYLDPNLLPRLAGRRVLLVDDAVSRGTSMAAAYALLRPLPLTIVGAVVAMAQTDAWRTALPDLPLRAVFATPLFERRADGWWVVP